MEFFLYRHPLSDEEGHIYLGKFSTYREAEIKRDSLIDDEFFFYEDYYIVESAHG